MAAQNGQLVMGVGAYRKVLNVYFDDTNLHPVTFSADGKADANAPNAYFTPKPGFWLMDLALNAAPAVTTAIVKLNDQPVTVLSLANHTAAILNRPPLGIEVRPGDKLTIIQAT